MGRAFADAVALFCLPFVIYGGGLMLARRYPFLAAHWPRRRIALLVMAGLGLVLTGMLAVGFGVPRHLGGYVPAHLDHGRLVPGRIE